jgi:DNA-binding beta-propeller fold protein YncE
MKSASRRLLPLLAILPALAGCMRWDYGQPEDFEAAGSGLFIVNEGNFQYGNATLSYYDPEAGHVENEVFYRANAMKLGDVAQSMTVRGGVGWIAVNNSHVVFAIDTETFREVGRITGFTSPRYIHFVSDRKAYVTQMWDSRIFMIDPEKYEITGYIECPGMDPQTGSTEQMVQFGKYVFVSCWSYQNRILKIDTETDEVMGQLEIGIQPSSLVLDRNGKIWALTDGGYAGSPYGHEAPALWRIDAGSFTVEKKFEFQPGAAPSELQLDGAKERLYWIDQDVWSMDVEAETVPVRPLVEYAGTLYYGLTVDPVSGDVYVADAIDYQQQGMVCRYTAAGELVDRFYAGITPGAFCWK